MAYSMNEYTPRAKGLVFHNGQGTTGMERFCSTGVIVAKN